MKSLALRPLLLSFLLSLPLWVIFDNFIVALVVALLLGFLVSMCRSLYLINQNKLNTRPQAPTGKSESRR
ncbi:MAG: hypothetical protein AB7E12_04670 [Burkholderiaceae bacterium]